MLSLDDRQLLVELQSLGVRVVDETAGPLPGRLGGAGPSDALFLWVRGLPLTEMKKPPSSTPEPRVANAITSADGCGFHGSSAPVVGFTAAAHFRSLPFTDPK